MPLTEDILGFAMTCTWLNTWNLIAHVSVPLALPVQLVAVDHMGIELESTTAIKSFRNRFPDADVSGCYFHLGQSAWRKIVEEKLDKEYKSNPAFAIRVRRFLALAFVPPQRVHHYMRMIVQDEAHIGDGLLDEFASQLMSVLRTSLQCFFTRHGTCTSELRRICLGPTIQLKLGMGHLPKILGLIQISCHYQPNTEQNSTISSSSAISIEMARGIQKDEPSMQKSISKLKL